jgi:hypothetical protein
LDCRNIPNVFSHHITGDDVRRATTGITNETMVYDPTTTSVYTLATMSPNNDFDS